MPMHCGVLRTSSREMRSWHARASTRVTISALLPFFLCGMLAGCSQTTDEQAEGVATDTAITLTVDPARVTLINAGAPDNRTVLHRSTPDGEIQDLIVTTSTGFTQNTLARSTADFDAPAGGDVDSLTMHIHAVPETPSPRSEEHSWTLTFSDYESSNLSNEEHIRHADGFRVTLTATDTNQLTAVSFAAPEDADDDARALIEAAVKQIIATPLVFPTDALGLGAQWSVDSRVTGDATLLQTTTYTLTHTDGTRISVEAEITQRPSVTRIELGDTAGNLSSPSTTDTLSSSPTPPTEQRALDVLDTRTTSSVAFEYDLSLPLPLTGHVMTTTRTTYGENDSSLVVQQDATSAVRFGEEGSQ